MLQKYSYVQPADKNGIILARIFHIYQGSYHRLALTGQFVKVSVKVTKPNNWLKKKAKLKAILIRSKQMRCNIDGLAYKFNLNEVVCLKKRLTPIGGEIRGPILKNLKRKKFINSFTGVI